MLAADMLLTMRSQAALLRQAAAGQDHCCLPGAVWDSEADTGAAAGCFTA